MPFFRWPLIAGALSVAVAIGAPTSDGPTNEAVGPPKTPDGLAPCTTPLLSGADWPRHMGEKLTFSAELLGISMGEVDVETVGRDPYRGQAATLYRGQVRPSGLISKLFGLELSVAVQVPEASEWPVSFKLHYKFLFYGGEERDEFADRASQVISWRESDGQGKSLERRFAFPVRDFLSAVFFARSLKPGASGCTVLYGNNALTQSGYRPRPSKPSIRCGVNARQSALLCNTAPTRSISLGGPSCS
jgi:hypothetical protein